MSLPQLPRLAIKPEVKEEDAEIWQPTWQCFCCQDSGVVHPHLAELIIADYNHKDDRLPICQSPKCDKGEKWLHLGENNLDQRFNKAICQQLDRYNRDGWKKTREAKVIDLSALIKKRSMSGTRDRTENDEREAAIRKAETDEAILENWRSLNEQHTSAADTHFLVTKK